MLIESRRTKSGVFQKEWVIPKAFQTKSLKQRLRLIEACSELSLHSMPPISHVWNGNTLTQTMPLLLASDFSGMKDAAKEVRLEVLAKDIDCLHSNGLIHGDIHPKNVIFTGDQLVLVDFEPFLERQDGPITYYCSTPPWIAHRDLKSKTLSKVTDRIGFLHTALRLLGIGIPKFNTIRTFRERRKSDYPIGGTISDSVVAAKNCEQILAHIHRNYLTSPS